MEMNFDFNKYSNKQIKNNKIEDLLLPDEIYKETKYKGYFITNKGRIISSPNYTRSNFRIINSIIDSIGYEIVHIKGKNIKVHRLIAEAFIPNPNNYPIVNHKDENRSNNNINNLEWCTNEYNIAYSCGKKVKQIDINTKQIIAIFDSALQAANSVNGANSHILDVCNRKRKYKTAYGYIWRFIDDNDYELNFNEGNKKKIIMLNLKNEKLKEFNSIGEASKVMNVGITAISNNLNGRSKSCKGYKFIYK